MPHELERQNAMANITRADLWAKGPYTLWNRGGGHWDVEDRDNDRVFMTTKKLDAQFVCDALNAAWASLPESTNTEEEKR